MLRGVPRQYDEEGRRVKAAVAYSRINRKRFAEKLGLDDPRTLDRTSAGQRPPTLPELRAIAKTSGVPLLFLTHGWSLYEGLEKLRAQDANTADDLMDQLRRVREAGARTRRSAQSRPDEDRRQEGV